ncbi:MAG TPA: phosphoribosylanthranilate isomerase [Anaerolineae bacterium]|nr:phosphoribosylanthranilate isomerase [Anaerolineae bacterium]
MTRVKICGITNVEDALATAEAGADLLGFLFYPPSPRAVTPEQTRRIVEAVRRAQFTVRFVGVFVDEEADAVQQIVACCGLDYAQLHGVESPGMVADLMGRGLKVIKAFRVRDGTTLTEIERYRATAYLLDAYVPGRQGGTGRTFDWNLAVQARQYGPIILAGGLTPDNVAGAVRTVRPWGVDVASGVEAVPGRKDPAKVRRFIACAKTGPKES